MKKTKIVCTIGPASEDLETLKKLMLLGMNVCRLNFSHGNHEEHLVRINNIKKAREELDLPVAIMLDTKGPEIRIGDFSVDQIQLSIGDTFILTTREVLGDQSQVSVSYKDLPKDVKIGSHILVDDGLVDLQVTDVTDTDIVTKVINYGVLKSRKGVNVPNTSINLPSITEKDYEDLVFGVKNGIDFVAASFIRKADDVINIRKILEENGGSEIQIISKIESQEGVTNLDEIIEASDGIMVARGDLGVEIKTEIMPLVQKQIIRKANLSGKPVITATQMLDSMIRNPRPTRAEVTDVANAILDGSDAIMLSGETAAGTYPVEAVKVMGEIAVSTEISKDFQNSTEVRSTWVDGYTTSAISRSTRDLAGQLGASAILTATTTGSTSKAVSRLRPNTPIIAATYDESIMRKLALSWGVYPVISEICSNTDEVIDRSIMAAMEKNLVKEGDLIVITAGVPAGIGGTTNLIKVHTIGEIIMKGQGIGKESVIGMVKKGNTAEELINKFKDGDILVTGSVDKEMVTFFERAGAVVVEEGGLTSHGAIMALHFKKPTVVGAQDAMQLLEDEMLITVDSLSGSVYKGSARVL
ncbi:pyruvate kinase [Lagierella sp.]|uniref:pyruvate kinase n=1 Tax=Lagierella sp. TaxID=2849657 RepID=UPI00262D9114|nr:pyruvate kinase [Lagierella sp.]